MVKYINGALGTRKEKLCKWYPSEGCVCGCGSDISGAVCHVSDEDTCPHAKEKEK